MSTMDGLNAGAATFTPGGGGGGGAGADVAIAPHYTEADAHVEEYGFDDTSENNRMMDEIEAEIEGGHHNPNFVTTYTDLPPHADEFWFPECRNCTCCNGYKHGCQCCAKQGMRSCKCAPSTGPTSTMAANSASAQPPPPAAAGGGWMPAVPGPGTGGGMGGPGGGYAGPGGHPGGGGGGPGYGPGGHGGGRGYHPGGGGGRGGGGGPPMCRFFTSPQGCRFGDKCRFSHG